MEYQSTLGTPRGTLTYFRGVLTDAGVYSQAHTGVPI